MNQICQEGMARGLKHYFYGGTQETLNQLVEKLKLKFADIQIAGTYSPGYLQVGDEESLSVIERMNQSGADILWVGLGSPKQDYWMAQHRFKITIPVMIGAGAAFDFLAGVKPQAPRWMQRSGLEWIFRLLTEPKRLWRRYLLGNPRFVYLILMREIFKRPRFV